MSERAQSQTAIEECPNCGETNDLVRGDEHDEGMFSHNETVCYGCDRVFDAFGEQTGGVNSDVARELHSSMVDALKQAAAERDDS